MAGAPDVSLAKAHAGPGLSVSISSVLSLPPAFLSPQEFRDFVRDGAGGNGHIARSRLHAGYDHICRMGSQGSLPAEVLRGYAEYFEECGWPHHARKIRELTARPALAGKKLQK